jgi:hypothetical protein
MAGEINIFQALQTQPDLLAQVLNQLYKDVNLNPEELPWESDSELAYEKFYSGFRSHVDQRFNSNRSRFMQLMYRVDIPQSKYEQALRLTEDEDRIDKLTHLILNRVLQKVLTRIHLKP